MSPLSRSSSTPKTIAILIGVAIFCAVIYFFLYRPYQKVVDERNYYKNIVTTSKTRSDSLNILLQRDSVIIYAYESNIKQMHQHLQELQKQNKQYQDRYQQLLKPIKDRPVRFIDISEAEQFLSDRYELKDISK